MNRKLLVLLLLLLLPVAAPAEAARIYAIDPETGQTTVNDTAPEKEPVAREKPAPEGSDLCLEEKKEIRKLREIVMRQQRSLQIQKSQISRMQDELRKKDNVIQGLDLLRRQGR